MRTIRRRRFVPLKDVCLILMAGGRNVNGELFPDQHDASCKNGTVTPIIIGPACSPLTGSSICGQPQLQTMLECAHPTANLRGLFPEHHGTCTAFVSHGMNTQGLREAQGCLACIAYVSMRALGTLA